MTLHAGFKGKHVFCVNVIRLVVCRINTGLSAKGTFKRLSTTQHTSVLAQKSDIPHGHAFGAKDKDISWILGIGRYVQNDV